MNCNHDEVSWSYTFLFMGKQKVECNQSICSYQCSWYSRLEHCQCTSYFIDFAGPRLWIRNHVINVHWRVGHRWWPLLVWCSRFTCRVILACFVEFTFVVSIVRDDIFSAPLQWPLCLSHSLTITFFHFQCHFVRLYYIMSAIYFLLGITYCRVRGVIYSTLLTTSVAQFLFTSGGTERRPMHRKIQWIAGYIKLYKTKRK